jgi:hypothetical protein
MKNLVNIKNVGNGIAALMVISQLISCNKSVTEKPLVKNEEKAMSVSVEYLHEETIRKPIVFIAGVDQGNHQYYTNARDYFTEKQFGIIDNAFSLQEIIIWLNKNYDGNAYGEIHIVTLGNPWNGIELETTINSGKTTNETLENALTEGKLPQVENVISEKTKIIFHSYGLGENEDLMKTLSNVFHAEKTPNIIASPYYSIFGGNFSKHFLATAYYAFYPTAKSPGKMDLSKEMARKYPAEKEINWFETLNNKEERYVGEAYTHQYNIPVNFELDFANSDQEVPLLITKADVLRFISQNEFLLKEISKMEIPLEKFRWSTHLKNNTLFIKGITTVLCVLKPIIKPYGDLQHLEAEIDNKRFYATF